jgi:hypothetical protein
MADSLSLHIGCYGVFGPNPLAPSAPPWVGTPVLGCAVPFTIRLGQQPPPLVPEHTILIAICLGP